MFDFSKHPVGDGLDIPAQVNTVLRQTGFFQAKSSKDETTLGDIALDQIPQSYVDVKKEINDFCIGKVNLQEHTTWKEFFLKKCANLDVAIKLFISGFEFKMDKIIEMPLDFFKQSASFMGLIEEKNGIVSLVDQSNSPLGNSAFFKKMAFVIFEKLVELGIFSKVNSENSYKKSEILFYDRATKHGENPDLDFYDKFNDLVADEVRDKTAFSEIFLDTDIHIRQILADVLEKYIDVLNMIKNWFLIVSTVVYNIRLNACERNENWNFSIYNLAFASDFFKDFISKFNGDPDTIKKDFIESLGGEYDNKPLLLYASGIKFLKAINSGCESRIKFLRNAYSNCLVAKDEKKVKDQFEDDLEGGEVFSSLKAFSGQKENYFGADALQKQKLDISIKLFCKEYFEKEDLITQYKKNESAFKEEVSNYFKQLFPTEGLKQIGQKLRLYNFANPKFGGEITELKVRNYGQNLKGLSSRSDFYDMRGKNIYYNVNYVKGFEGPSLDRYIDLLCSNMFGLDSFFNLYEQKEGKKVDKQVEYGKDLTDFVVKKFLLGNFEDYFEYFLPVSVVNCLKKEKESEEYYNDSSDNKKNKNNNFKNMLNASEKYYEKRKKDFKDSELEKKFESNKSNKSDESNKENVFNRLYVSLKKYLAEIVGNISLEALVYFAKVCSISDKKIDLKKYSVDNITNTYNELVSFKNPDDIKLEVFNDYFNDLGTKAALIVGLVESAYAVYEKFSTDQSIVSKKDYDQKSEAGNTLKNVLERFTGISISLDYGDIKVQANEKQRDALQETIDSFHDSGLVLLKELIGVLNYFANPNFQFDTFSGDFIKALPKYILDSNNKRGVGTQLVPTGNLLSSVEKAELFLSYVLGRSKIFEQEKNSDLKKLRGFVNKLHENLLEIYGVQSDVSSMKGEEVVENFLKAVLDYLAKVFGALNTSYKKNSAWILQMPKSDWILQMSKEKKVFEFDEQTFDLDLQDLQSLVEINKVEINKDVKSNKLLLSGVFEKIERVFLKLNQLEYALGFKLNSLSDCDEDKKSSISVFNGFNFLNYLFKVFLGGNGSLVKQNIVFLKGFEEINKIWLLFKSLCLVGGKDNFDWLLEKNLQNKLILLNPLIIALQKYNKQLKSNSLTKQFDDQFKLCKKAFVEKQDEENKKICSEFLKKVGIFVNRFVDAFSVDEYNKIFEKKVEEEKEVEEEKKVEEDEKNKNGNLKKYSEDEFVEENKSSQNNFEKNILNGFKNLEKLKKYFIIDKNWFEDFKNYVKTLSKGSSFGSVDDYVSYTAEKLKELLKYFVELFSHFYRLDLWLGSLKYDLEQFKPEITNNVYGVHQSLSGKGSEQNSIDYNMSGKLQSLSNFTKEDFYKNVVSVDFNKSSEYKESFENDLFDKVNFHNFIEKLFPNGLFPNIHAFEEIILKIAEQSGFGSSGKLLSKGGKVNDEKTVFYNRYTCFDGLVLVYLFLEVLSGSESRVLLSSSEVNDDFFGWLSKLKKTEAVEALKDIYSKLKNLVDDIDLFDKKNETDEINKVNKSGENGKKNESRFKRLFSAEIKGLDSVVSLFSSAYEVYGWRKEQDNRSNEISPKSSKPKKGNSKPKKGNWFQKLFLTARKDEQQKQGVKSNIFSLKPGNFSFISTKFPRPEDMNKNIYRDIYGENEIKEENGNFRSHGSHTRIDSDLSFYEYLWKTDYDIDSKSVSQISQNPTPGGTPAHSRQESQLSHSRQRSQLRDDRGLTNTDKKKDDDVRNKKNVENSSEVRYEKKHFKFICNFVLKTLLPFVKDWFVFTKDSPKEISGNNIEQIEKICIFYQDSRTVDLDDAENENCFNILKNFIIYVFSNFCNCWLKFQKYGFNSKFEKFAKYKDFDLNGKAEQIGRVLQSIIVLFKRTNFSNFDSEWNRLDAFHRNGLEKYFKDISELFSLFKDFDFKATFFDLFKDYAYKILKPYAAVSTSVYGVLSKIFNETFKEKFEVKVDFNNKIIQYIERLKDIDIETEEFKNIIFYLLEYVKSIEMIYKKLINDLDQKYVLLVRVFSEFFKKSTLETVNFFPHELESSNELEEKKYVVVFESIYNLQIIRMWTELVYKNLEHMSSTAAKGYFSILCSFFENILHVDETDNLCSSIKHFSHLMKVFYSDDFCKFIAKYSESVRECSLAFSSLQNKTEKFDYKNKYLNQVCRCLEELIQNFELSKQYANEYFNFQRLVVKKFKLFLNCLDQVFSNLPQNEFSSKILSEVISKIKDSLFDFFIKIFPGFFSYTCFHSNSFRLGQLEVLPQDFNDKGFVRIWEKLLTSFKEGFRTIFLKDFEKKNNTYFIGSVNMLCEKFVEFFKINSKEQIGDFFDFAKDVFNFLANYRGVINSYNEKFKENKFADELFLEDFNTDLWIFIEEFILCLLKNLMKLKGTVLDSLNDFSFFQKVESMDSENSLNLVDYVLKNVDGLLRNFAKYLATETGSFSLEKLKFFIDDFEKKLKNFNSVRKDEIENSFKFNSVRKDEIENSFKNVCASLLDLINVFSVFLLNKIFNDVCAKYGLNLKEI